MEETLMKTEFEISSSPLILSPVDDIPVPIPQPKKLSNFTPKALLYLRVSFLGTCFALIFLGFNVSQSYVTSLFPGSFGYTVLLLIYAFFGVFSLAAPTVTKLVAKLTGPARSERISMFSSSIAYFLFTFFLAIGVQWLVGLSAVLCGISAGILWINQGAWTARLVRNYEVDEKIHDGVIIGTVTGLFFMIMNMSGILGNAIAIIFLKFGSLKVLLYIMSGIVAVGAILIFFTVNVPFIEPELVLPVQAKEKTFDIDHVLRFVKLRKTRYLTPYHFVQGVNTAFSFGNFPTFCNYATKLVYGTAVSQQTLATNIAVSFLLYNVGATAGSFLWGKIYDRFKGIGFLLIIHLLLDTLAFSLLIPVVVVPWKTIAPIYIVGFLFGLIDYLANCVSNSSNSNIFDPKDVPIAFSWYRFVFCVGFSIESVASAILPGVDAYVSPNFVSYGWAIMVAFKYGCMMVSVFCGFILQFHILKKGPTLPKEENIN